LHKHIQRASNQAAVHRRSLSVTQTFLLQSTMAGRWLGSSMRWTGCHFHQLQRRSLSLFTAPAKKINCVRGKCTCTVYELPCTNLCKCTNCDNRTVEEDYGGLLYSLCGLTDLSLVALIPVLRKSTCSPYLSFSPLMIKYFLDYNVLCCEIGRAS